MIRSSKTFRALIIAGTFATAFIATPALADKDKDESGHGHQRHDKRGHEHGEGRGHGPKIEVHDNGKDYKYEYKDHRCKYEYQLNYRTGKEKIEQKGDCRGVSPRRALYPVEVPIVHEDREYDRAPPSPSARRTACNRDVIGAVIGGVAGGVIGSNVGSGDGRKVATVAGAIVGAVIGGTIGRRMDRADNGCAYQAFEFAAPGETVFWRNPDSAVEYGITPAQLTRASNGGECRTYKASVMGSSTSEQDSSGLACRLSDGSWQIQ
jgi:surface antigen